jgi:hypothetical protein
MPSTGDHRSDECCFMYSDRGDQREQLHDHQLRCWRECEHASGVLHTLKSDRG